MFLVEKSILIHLFNFILMLIIAGFTLRAIEALTANTSMGQALAYIY